MKYVYIQLKYFVNLKGSSFFGQKIGIWKIKFKECILKEKLQYMGSYFIFNRSVIFKIVIFYISEINKFLGVVIKYQFFFNFYFIKEKFFEFCMFWSFYFVKFVFYCLESV